MTAPVKRYPAGEVTPAGWYHIVNGTRPMMWLKAWDGSIRFDMLGGLAPPFHDPMYPDAVAVRGLKGLIPPWRHITQKGATEDGVTHVDALYEPIEVELDLECIGADQRAILRVVDDLIASIDAKQTSELGWFTRDLGYWWSDVRWLKGGMAHDLAGVQTRRQRFPLRLQADNGFWRTYDHAGMFAPSYELMAEEFGTDYADNAGPDWPLYFDEDGGGHPYVDGGQFRWLDDPDDWLLTETREVVCGPYKNFSTLGDNQIASMQFGSMQEWSLPAGAANDLWVRMGRDENGDWDGNGVRMRIENNIVKLSRFNDFTQTVMRQALIFFPPLPGETFSLVAGYPGDSRVFKVLRNGLEILAHKESGTGSMLGADYRGIGFGVQAGAAILTQATPATLRRVTAGDNTTIAQSGFVKMVNVGDQPMYWDATIFGPATSVKLYDGPGTDEFVEFGPVLPNQIVFIRTDPRVNTSLVQDLSVVPPTQQQLNVFQEAVSKLLSFAGFNNSALGDQIKSLFGIKTAQGNLYKYLKGRFSDRAAIPPKSPGNPAQPYFIKVELAGGNVDSKVILTGTPLRRYPLR